MNALAIWGILVGMILLILIISRVKNKNKSEGGEDDK